MNKKNVVTRVNIDKVAKFLLDSVNWLLENDCGCCHFNLSSDLAIYVGWENGYGPDDTDIIKSREDERRRQVESIRHCFSVKPSEKEVQARPETECWAIVAAVKVRNDYDCADYEYLQFPYYSSDGEVWNSSVIMSPNRKKRIYNADARYLLEAFVGITNAYNRGEVDY